MRFRLVAGARDVRGKDQWRRGRRRLMEVIILGIRREGEAGAGKKKPSAKKEHDVMALAEPRQRETRKRTMAGEKISFFRPKMVAAIWRVN